MDTPKRHPTYWKQIESGLVFVDRNYDYGQMTRGEVMRACEFGSIETFWVVKVRGMAICLRFADKEEACKYVETVVALKGNGT